MESSFLCPKKPTARQVVMTPSSRMTAMIGMTVFYSDQFLQFKYRIKAEG